MATTTLESLRPFWKSLLLVTCLTFGGCASMATAPSADQTAPETAGSPVVLLDEDMNHYVAVDNVISTRNENGYLLVQANIRSQTEKDITVQAQTLFYDKNGLILNSAAGAEAPWTTIPLAANAVFPYRVQALTVNAQKYSIRLRYLGRKTYQ